MRSKSIDAMTPRLRRILSAFGRDISIARRKRGLPMELMAQRASMAMATYQRVEKGDPTVSFGAVAMVLMALGLSDRLSLLLDVSKDDVGLIQDEKRLPKRVVMKRRRLDVVKGAV